jgi:UDP-2,4-diacetamido-2,4,6-trideoxy-beta-L-altropyranose hydrolase
MKVAFRTDATNKIGTGHFMRCLALACELKKQGAHILFLSRNLPEYFSNILCTKEIEYIPLDTVEVDGLIDDLAHASWLGASQTEDSKAAIKALSEQVWDWLVVDHYALDFRWESALRQSAKNIMVIDDLADRHHECDVLLDQNYYADMQTRYTGKLPAYTQLLLGPRYALLREEFVTLREHLRIRTGEVKKILVFFGGVDAKNYTLQTIEALSEISSELEVDVVIGAQHPSISEIEVTCKNKGFICHVQTPHMAKLMADADLAIGAGGSASWERCCLGLPSLLIALADNQIAIAKELESINACVYLGSSDSIISLNLKQCISQILSNPERARKISENAFAIADGLGVSRVSNEMRVCL